MGDLHSASVAQKVVVEEHAQWRNPDLKSRLDASQAPAVGGVDAATSAWVAEVCNRALGQKCTEEEEEMHGGLANAAEERKLNARKQS